MSDHPDHPERQWLESEFLLAIRRTGAVMQLMGQLAAERLGMNATDLNCLNLVQLTGAMTAGELAKATGLTTASITAVLDRLEKMRYLKRERDATDRRRVNVNLDPSCDFHGIAAIFGPMLFAWREAASHYSDEQLRLILGFQMESEQIVRGQLSRLVKDRP